MIFRIVRQCLFRPQGRYAISYVDKTQKLIDTFEAQNIKQTVKALDYLYSNRQYVQSHNKALYSVGEKVYDIIDSQRADIDIIRIYENLMALKINKQEIRNVIVKRIKDRLREGRFGIEQLQLAYFVVSRLPYHSILQQLSSMTIKMHEYQIPITSVKSYLTYSKLCVLLKSIGFEREMPPWQQQYKMQDLMKEDILSLVYNIGILTPDNPELIYRLLQIYQLADQMTHDQYLHKIQYIESDEGENKAKQVYDIVNWYDVALLCRLASTVQLQQQQYFKIAQMIQRKFETEDIDFQNAVDLVRFGVQSPTKGSDVVVRCLETIREMDEEDMTTVPLRSIAEFLKIVKNYDINQEFITMFMEVIPKNKLDYDEETVQMLRESLAGRQQSPQLKKFVQQQ